MLIYLYKEYSDNLAYGEEYIKAFANKTGAIQLQRKRLKEEYGTANLDEIRRTGKEVWASHDSVTVYDWNDSYYYCIEELPLDLPENVSIPLSDGNTLVAEKGDPSYNEICIGLENKDGGWFQDLVVVGQAYDIASEPIPESYRVCVYADPDSEDYTNYFPIKAHKEPETEPEGLIGKDDASEFVGGVIDVFEDFCEKHGISPENEEKPAIITGELYDELKNKLKEHFTNWKVL